MEHKAFEDLPTRVALELKTMLLDGIEHTIEQDTTYSEDELREITKAWIKVINSVHHGLPNQLYEYFIRTLDPPLAKKAHERYTVWSENVSGHPPGEEDEKWDETYLLEYAEP